MMRPVSYVVTVFNKAPFLPLVLDALARELAESDGEIVLVDDGSTDGSLDCLQAFAATCRSVRVLAKANGGVASATNVAVAAASCPLLRIVDGDDIVVPGSTALLARALSTHGAGLAFGRHALYRPDALPAPVRAEGPSSLLQDPLRQALRANLFVPTAALADRTAVAAAFPLHEAYRASQDFALSIRFVRLTGVAAVDATCCWIAMEAPHRLSSSKARMFADSARLIAEDWEAGVDWSSAHRRYAVRRAAGRAGHYARRHLAPDLWRRAWLAGTKLAALLPWGVPGPETMRRIAATYDEATARPQHYP
jgi:glycosyltransferase involved in cell wall biosynthesis